MSTLPSSLYGLQALVYLLDIARGGKGVTEDGLCFDCGFLGDKATICYWNASIALIWSS